MLLINEVTKQLIFSHGKNGTTSVADPLQRKDPNWKLLDLSHLQIHPYGMFRNYNAFILFRDPYERYISGLLEDISMLMLPDQDNLKYNRQIIHLNSDAQIISHKQISDERSAVLLVEKNVNYFKHMIIQLFKYNGNDYSISNSYHVGNWLWEAFAIHSIVDTTFWIDLPNLDSFFKKNFDIELPRMNVKSTKDKDNLKLALESSYHGDPVNDYLTTEFSMYDIIMNNRNDDYTLKDFTDNNELASKISYCVYDNYTRQANRHRSDGMIKTFISLIFQKHWDRK